MTRADPEEKSVNRWENEKGRVKKHMSSTEKDKTQNRMTRQVFYADVRMTRALLVNEWDKKRFLNAIEEARSLLRVEVYAFCVLDDRFRLLAGGKDVKNRTVRRLVSAALELFERDAELLGEKNMSVSGMQVRANIVRIEDEKDALAVMRFIHLTPFSEGYTISAQDYWWTSFSTYRGHYNWTLLDTAPVMQYLSNCPGRVSGTLTEYHRRGEALRNPVPSCIRKGEFEILPQGGVCFPQGNINETFMVQA